MITNQHRAFLGRVAGSQGAVSVIAQMQRAKGRLVEVPRLRYAPTAAQAAAYFDDGDLFVIVDGRRWGIEVKHRFDINFTGLRDWPFEDMILSNVTAANRHRNVMAYATLSGDLRYAGIVRGDTRQHWHTVQTWCKNTHNVERFYATPLEYVTFERTIMP